MPPPGGSSTANGRAILRRHAERMAIVASELEGMFWQGGHEAEAAHRAAIDHDNLVAAVEWGTLNDPEVALRIVVGLSGYWIAQPDTGQPIRWLRLLLDRVGVDHPDYPIGLAILVRLVARYEGGAAGVAAAGDIAALVDRVESRLARRLLCGSMAMAQLALGNLDAAGEWGLRGSDAVDDANVAASLAASSRAYAMRGRGDYKAALRELRAAVEASRRSKQRTNQAIQLGAVALVELRLGRPQRAVAAASEATQLNADGHLAAGGWDALAIASAETGDLKRALAAIDAAWSLAERAGPAEQVDVLEAAVPVLVEVGNDALAVEALVTAAEARPATGWARFPEIDWVLGRCARRMRRRLGATRLAILEAEAGGASVADVVARVLHVSLETSTATTGHRLRGPAVDDLTSREVEVLALVAEGMSDREIGSTLFISAKTASVYVSRIKAKLGTSSRVDLALRARSLGLESDRRVGGRPAATTLEVSGPTRD